MGRGLDLMALPPEVGNLAQLFELGFSGKNNGPTVDTGGVDAVEATFHAPKAGDLTHIGLAIGTATGPPNIDGELYGVGSNGHATSSLSLGTFTARAATSGLGIGIALDSSVTVTKGQRLAAVLYGSGGTSFRIDSAYSFGLVNWLLSFTNGLASPVENTNWAELGGAPYLRLRYSDGSVHGCGDISGHNAVFALYGSSIYAGWRIRMPETLYVCGVFGQLQLGGTAASAGRAKSYGFLPGVNTPMVDGPNHFASAGMPVANIDVGQNNRYRLPWTTPDGRLQVMRCERGVIYDFLIGQAAGGGSAGNYIGLRCGNGTDPAAGGRHIYAPTSPDDNVRGVCSLSTTSGLSNRAVDATQGFEGGLMVIPERHLL